MTWYDPDEVKDQADGNQIQPEFNPAASVFTEVHIGEEVGIYTTAYLAFKAKFDSEYTA